MTDGFAVAPAGARRIHPRFSLAMYLKNVFVALLFVCGAVWSQADVLPQAKRNAAAEAGMTQKAQVSDLKADLVYKKVGDIDLTMDLMLPKVTQDAKGKPLFPNGTPVVFYVHGGGWRAGTRYNSPADVEYLSNNGIAVATVTYRFAKNDGNTVETCVTDCFDAVRYVAKHAKEYGLDSNTFLVYGHSAGGHLSLMLLFADPAAFPGDPALADASFKFVGGVPMAPPTNFASLEGWTKNSWLDKSDNRLNALGGEIKDRQALADKVSPLLWLKKGAPRSVIIHGTDDPIVPFAQSRMVKQKADELGVDMVVLEIPNADHGYRGKRSPIDRGLAFEIACYNLAQMAKETSGAGK